MIPYVWRTAAVAAIVASTAATFGIMDASPGLWFYDKIFVSDRRLQQHFQDKRIWITGASSGIGAALAMKLSKSGALLILSARNEAKLRQVSTLCPGETTILPLDVTSAVDVDKAVQQVGGDIDYLILNAGVGHLRPALQTTMEETERLLQVNTLAPIQMATKWLQQRKKGQLRYLVVTSSVASLFAVPLSASYAASKHAVHGYFQSLRSECSPWLRVDLPCPGPVATEFHVNNKGINAGAVNGDSASRSSNGKEMKMPVERSARLIVSSMLIPGRGGRETWIAQQPTLLFCFLNQYMPLLASWMLNKIGPTRLALLEAGLNLYDPSSLGKLKKVRKAQQREKEAGSIPR